MLFRSCVHKTFCYGLLSCKLYNAGPNRKAKGRNGMVYIEEDWVDEEMTGHREMDDYAQQGQIPVCILAVAKKITLPASQSD